MKEEELFDEEKEREREILRQHEFQRQRQAQRLEDEAAWEIREVVVQTSAVLEEQRRGIINQAT